MRRSALPRGFGVIWTTVAIDLIGFGIILPVLPLYARRTFHASPAVDGLLVASFSIAQLLLAPAWGRLSDRVGRKPVLLVSLVGTAVGSLLTGLAGGLFLLFVGRIVDGGSGASVSVAQASVSDVAEPHQRAHLFGLLGAAFGLGFVIGPAIGGVFSLVSPRLPFFVAAAIAGVNALVAVRRLPETSTRTSHRPVRTRAWAKRGMPQLLLVGLLAVGSFSAFEATFSLFGHRRLGLGQSSVYGLFAGIGLVIVANQALLVRPLVTRLGDRGALLLGLMLTAIGLGWLGTVHSLTSLIPCLLVLTSGQGLITPTLAASIVGVVAGGDRGLVLGVQQSVSGLARVLGPALGGLAYGHWGVASPYLGGAAVVVAALALASSLPRPVHDTAVA